MEGVSLELNREPLSYTTLHPYERDPDWTFRDAQGHEHDATLATLEWIVTNRYWCSDCRDWHEEGEYRCRLCREAVSPGERYIGHGPHYLPGLLEGKLTVTRDEPLIKTYFLRGDDFASIPHPLTEEWVAGIEEREPDLLEIPA